jgi:hypothetical protein
MKPAIPEGKHEYVTTGKQLQHFNNFSILARATMVAVFGGTTLLAGTFMKNAKERLDI